MDIIKALEFVRFIYCILCDVTNGATQLLPPKFGVTLRHKLGPPPPKEADVIIEWSLTTMNNTKQHGPSETPSGFFQNPWAIQEGLLFGRIRYSPRLTLS